MNDLVYIDTAVGGVYNRNVVVRREDFTPNGKRDVFATYRRFPPDLSRQVDSTGSVKGYQGLCHAPFYPLDVDVDGDPDSALDALRHILTVLHEVWEVPVEAVRIYFSGSKGYHLEIPGQLFGGLGVLPVGESASRMRRLLSHLFDDPAALHLDGGIYDALRLWRVPNTRHGKTGLFKVPITAWEAFNCSPKQILDLARSPRHIDLPDDDEWDTIPQLRELLESTSTAPSRSDTVPASAIECDQQFAKRCADGERIPTFTSLVAHWVARGLSRAEGWALAVQWNRNNIDPWTEERLR